MSSSLQGLLDLRQREFATFMKARASLTHRASACALSLPSAHPPSPINVTPFVSTSSPNLSPVSPSQCRSSLRSLPALHSSSVPLKLSSIPHSSTTTNSLSTIDHTLNPTDHLIPPGLRAIMNPSHHSQLPPVASLSTHSELVEESHRKRPRPDTASPLSLPPAKVLRVDSVNAHHVSPTTITTLTAENVKVATNVLRPLQYNSAQNDYDSKQVLRSCQNVHLYRRSCPLSRQHSATEVCFTRPASLFSMKLGVDCTVHYGLF